MLATHLSREGLGVELRLLRLVQHLLLGVLQFHVHVVLAAGNDLQKGFVSFRVLSAVGDFVLTAYSVNFPWTRHRWWMSMGDAYLELQCHRRALVDVLVEALFGIVS